MNVELITILVSLLILIVVYFSRIRSKQEGTVLFSEKFLHKADEKIFEFVKFIFRLYSLLFVNISTFLSKIPHKLIHNIHIVSHKIAQKSSEWIDKITHKTSK